MDISAGDGGEMGDWLERVLGEEGATAVEYAIIAALIAAVIVAVVLVLGQKVLVLFQSVPEF